MCENPLKGATPSSAFPIISDLLSGPFQLRPCWQSPRSMQGDICTSGISHPVFLNPCLPPVWTQPPIFVMHLANFICFNILSNDFVVRNVCKKEQSEGCGGGREVVDVLLLTFSGHSSWLSAVYPGCVYRGGWRVSTCSPPPAGMRSKGELEGEKRHTCGALEPLQLLEEDQRSEMSGSR